MDSMSSRIKHLVVATCGNFIQWFDNTLFFVMMPLIIYNFTPKELGIESLLTLLITFSATLLTRPFGAIIFSNLADHFGRKQILIVTAFVMGASTLFLALCPDESVIGVAAPALLLLFTFMHGFASGGEWPNSASYIYEISAEKERMLAGFIAAFQLVLGLITSNVLITLFVETKNYFFEGVLSWRILFVVSTIISFIAARMRFHLKESPKWHHTKEKFALLKCLNQNKKMLLASFGISALDGVLFNAFFSIEYPYTPLYVNRAFSLVNTGLILILGYFIYRFAKAVGHLRSLRYALLVSIGLSVVELIVHNFNAFEFIRIVYAIPAFLYLIPLPTLQPSLFHPANRAFCVALSRTVSIFIFGGLGMLLLKLTHMPARQAFALYLLLSAIISFTAVQYLIKKRPNHI